MTAQTDATLAALGHADERAFLELRRRHRNAALVYGRICGSDADATVGEELADRAVELAEQETPRGIRPHGTWRHRLLLFVQQAAVEWQAAGLRERLDPGFAAWLDGALGNAGPYWAAERSWQERNSTLLASYRTLPHHTAGLLWHAVVEQQSDETAGLAVGFVPRDVPPSIPVALGQLRRAFLTLHLKRYGDEVCHGYRRDLESVGRPNHHSPTPELDAHATDCVCCGTAYSELVQLRDEPRAALAGGLLGWGADMYANNAPVWGEPRTAPPDAAPLTGFWGHGALDRVRRLRRPVTASSVAMTAGAVTAVGGALVALGAGANSGATDMSATARPSIVTVTAIRPAPPRSSETADEPSPSAPGSSPAPAPTPTGIPGDANGLVVNADSGLCLDIEDGKLKKGTDVVTAECGDARTQQWRWNSKGRLQSHADSDYCLDSHGDTDNAVGIGLCSPAEDGDIANLIFFVGRDGIRPAIDTSRALTPRSDRPGSTLHLPEHDLSERQEWAAAEPP